MLGGRFKGVTGRDGTYVIIVGRTFVMRNSIRRDHLVCGAKIRLGGGKITSRNFTLSFRYMICTMRGDSRARTNAWRIKDMSRLVEIISCSDSANRVKMCNIGCLKLSITAMPSNRLVKHFTTVMIFLAKNAGEQGQSSSLP
jgi:hypothetical protein